MIAWHGMVKSLITNTNIRRVNIYIYVFVNISIKDTVYIRKNL